ncbi:MAG: 3-isopropylmalate dehydrogenase [Akkermansia sp.]|nr:3-isopropylmalate dehydrogenase [Akkermansia sp.]
MNSYKIAVLAGDGIGPEVMNEALRVLDAVEAKFGFTTERTSCFVGGAAIDHCGKALPAETLAACEAADAILFGSVGGPKWDVLPPDERPERGALLPLRKHFGLYANLRPGICLPELVDASPVKNSIIPNGFDILCVRELTGGMYFGQPKFYGERDGEVVALDTLFYRKSEVERIAKVAFEAARGRSGRLCSVDKANVLSSSVMWRDVMNAMAPEYPDVQLTHMYVDNAAMQLVRNPGQFDVMVTENTFGDILTDEMAIVCGSLGMLPSASLCCEDDSVFGLYEPSGGSAPDIAGQGIANPIAQILSMSMLLRYTCRETAAADAVDAAVRKVIAAGYRTGDLATGAEGEIRVGTTGMGDAIIAAL